jgi:hypothetical protein
MQRRTGPICDQLHHHLHRNCVLRPEGGAHGIHQQCLPAHAAASKFDTAATPLE